MRGDEKVEVTFLVEESLLCKADFGAETGTQSEGVASVVKGWFCLVLLTFYLSCIGWGREVKGLLTAIECFVLSIPILVCSWSCLQ